MLSRFAGERGRIRLVEAIKAQKIVGQDDTLAYSLSECVQLRQLAAGETVVDQGAFDNDIYLILSGRLSVRVNGREVAIRETGVHVGEMALVDPAARRSATLVALEPTLVGIISESEFANIADAHPRIWKALATELASRLNQRGRFLRRPNDQPHVFIGSSSESLPIAKALETSLQGTNMRVTVWSDGVFGPSHFPVEDLQRKVDSSDFAVLVVGAEDRIISRGLESTAPRDNVIFELGLFMGALTRERTFLTVPKGIKIRIPSDLLGLTTLAFDPDVAPATVAVAPICIELAAAIGRLGPR